MYRFSIKSIKMHTKNTLNNVVLATFTLCHLIACSYVLGLSNIGINYGRLGSNLTSAYQSIQLIESMNASHVKLYDTNSEILKLLSGTKLQVTVTITNDLISLIAMNQSHADSWLRDNVLAYYPNTRIKYVLVGNELFAGNGNLRMWLDLVPAMQNIKTALVNKDIHNIKVGAPVTMSMLEETVPPSTSRFRADIWAPVIDPLLKFLNGSRSPLFVVVYPWETWAEYRDLVDLSYAMLEEGKNVTYKDPESGLIYVNLLDQMLDAFSFAMAKLGFNNVSLAISETGWPHAGDLDQSGASLYNAAVYNRNLVAKMTKLPAIGTPARPGVEILTFIFSLYDENRKPGPGTERHWGLLDSDGSPYYKLDPSGSEHNSDDDLPDQPESNDPYSGKIWCVAAGTATELDLVPALEFACQQSNGMCEELAPGRSCYEPITVTAHASFAFSSYWARFRSRGASCFFDGLAVQTIIDPSHGLCQYPSVSV